MVITIVNVLNEGGMDVPWTPQHSKKKKANIASPEQNLMKHLYCNTVKLLINENSLRLVAEPY